MGETSSASEAWIRSEQKLTAAHDAMLRTSGLQFSFDAPAPPRPPGWLQSALQLLAKALTTAAPVLQYVFWIGLAVGVALVVWVLIRDISPPRRKRRATPAATPDWRPDRQAAVALLENADLLAAHGYFDEAVHLLLFRSIEEIEGRRPGLVAPALTSRDIAGLERLPPQARAAFARIAQVVERSYFGGRAADRTAFEAARADYEAFAFPEAWA